MSVTISYEEWMAAVNHPSLPTEGAYTISQWAKRLGRNRQAVSGWVAEGLRNGWMRTGVAVVRELSGIERKVTGYALKGEET